MKPLSKLAPAIAIAIAAIGLAPHAKAIDVYFSGGVWKVRWADGRAINNSTGNFFRGLEAATFALDAERPDRTGPQGINVVAPAGTYNVGVGPANIRTGNLDINLGGNLGVRLNMTGNGVINLGGSNNINVRNADIVGLTTIAIGAIFSNACNNVMFENISVRTPGGTIGLRPQGGNYKVDSGYVSNISVRGTCNFSGMAPNQHGIETLAINNFSCPATVNTTDTGGCGLLLNKTRTATINVVNAVRADETNNSTDSTYSALRFANDCSNSSQYGITVNKLVARNCGRGFALLTSPGARYVKLKSVDITNSSNNGILLSSFVAGAPVNNFSVDGGRISGCGQAGLNIDDVTDSSFSNLDIYDNFYGLKVSNRAARLSFNNVQVHDNTRASTVYRPAVTSSINSNLGD